MKLIDVVRQANEKNGLTEDSRFAYTLLKIIDASIQGKKSIRIDGFMSWNVEEGDKMAKNIAKRLKKNGFNVSLKVRNRRIYQNQTRDYFFEVDWKDEYLSK